MTDPLDPARVLAIVIGRAGSRGLPGKNALDVAGRPMVAWSVAHAQSCPEIGPVVCSTDGRAIADAARAAGADIVDRPAELAGDTASVVDAARHAAETVESGGRTVDIVVILYANVPVRPGGLAGHAVRTLVETGADSVQSYAAVGKYHPAWMVRLGEDGEVAAVDPNAPDRRQDLERLHIPDGGVIAVRRPLLERGPHPHAFLGDDRRGIVTAPGDVVDVDDARDLTVARALLASAGDRGTPAHP